ncbi:alpha/beta hydrolase [Blastopirellula sp. JC732]|uniref:Alpha/beta hydrolase n=1 Tax=Blastopirellula sediminis TaxID=2894196 RepID=A0A9X1MSU8_9BACT|nr:alpha/beta hydrolase fold domain-containing protein [Blastopirellula sediminis]MCC9604841.1 alpha/beta hydrolase [Blastopirellula sediminis]MCC9631860.1 alpha/beta hydrolase [Blastopirellula sediminis]
MRLIHAASFVLALLVSSAAAFAAEYQTEKDIPYREGDNLSDYEKERCKVDVYYPADEKGFATVVWFHGGGITGGSKSVPKELQGKGFAVVAVNYRLSPKVTAPAYIEDAAAAIAWTFKNIERYGGDPNKIFVSGYSAGGYLTGIVCLDKRWLAAHEIDADKLAGFAPLSGQMFTHFTIRAERGIGQNTPIIDDLAPAYYPRKETPPMLLVTGDRELDMLGRYEENAYLCRMMTGLGNKQVKLHEVGGFNHGTAVPPALQLLVEFVKKQTGAK